MCRGLFSTEEPRSFGPGTNAAHLSPADSPEICPYAPWVADPLFAVNNSQETASDAGGSESGRRPLGGSDLLVPPLFFSVFSFCCFSCAEGYFWLPVLLASGKSYNSRMEVAGGSVSLLCCARGSLALSAWGQANSQAPWLTLTQGTCWESIAYIMSA